MVQVLKVQIKIRFAVGKPTWKPTRLGHYNALLHSGKSSTCQLRVSEDVFVWLFKRTLVVCIRYGFIKCSSFFTALLQVFSTLSATNKALETTSPMAFVPFKFHALRRARFHEHASTSYWFLGSAPFGSTKLGRQSKRKIRIEWVNERHLFFQKIRQHSAPTMSPFLKNIGRFFYWRTEPCPLA